MNRLILRVVDQIFAAILVLFVHRYWELSITDSILVGILWQLLNVGHELTRIRESGIPRAEDKYFE